MTLEEIGRADAKAGILFTGVGVFLGSAATVLAAGAARFSSLPLRLDVPLLVAVACAIGGFTALGGASYPRGLGGSELRGGRVMYFGDVVRITDCDKLR
jgi:hypothetical protein